MVLSVVPATARGQVGVLTTAGRLVRLDVLDLPTLPPTANAPHLQGGAPLGTFLDLDWRPVAHPERPLALCTLRADGPGLALGTRRAP